MIGFLGEYEIALDAKGRFLMPSGFRRQLPEEAALRFVIHRTIDTQSLSLYTEEQWSRISEKLTKLNNFNPKVQRFKRLFLNGATLLELDSAGRMLLPKPLQEFAGLRKELVFTAQVDKVEIWDKDKYYAYLKQNATELEDLSNEVFGSDIMDPFA